MDDDAMALKKILWLGGVLLWLTLPLVGHTQGMMDPVSFTLEQAPEQIEAGEPFQIRVRADIENNWHLYAVEIDSQKGPFPTKFTSESKKIRIDGTVDESEPERAYDPNFDVELRWHSDQARFTIPLVFHGQNSTGETLIDIAVEYQVCDDNICLPPQTRYLTEKVNVVGSASDKDTGKSSKSEG